MTRFLKLIAGMTGLLAFSISASFLNAAPYPPEGMIVEWTQPDGTRLKLRVFGDEFYGRTETMDGYTVAFDKNEKAYCYAEKSVDGQELLPTNERVGPQPKQGGQKGIKLDPEVVREKRAIRRALLAPNEDAKWEKRVKNAIARRALRKGTASAPVPQFDAGDDGEGGGPVASSGPDAMAVGGSIVGLTILVQFPDDTNTPAADPVNFPATQAKMQNYCNQIGYNQDGNTGSVRDYFNDQSLGALTYTNIVPAIVTLPNPRNWYNFDDHPTNSSLRDSGETGRLVVQHAIAELQTAGFDFTQLSLNGSDQVIATNILFAGDTSGVWSEGLWPHRWVMFPTINVGTGGNDIFIWDYQITNAASSAVPIGTFVHENGHLILDLPDIYDTNGGSEGVGEHCLMGSANHLNGGRTPGPINGYFKEVLGWSNVSDITAAQFLTVSLPTTGNHGRRIFKPGSTTEYFFVENRGTGDPWAAHTRDKGIIIWHIDETKNGNTEEQMTEAQHYEVSVEQADGDFDLENDVNRGDADDYYDSSTQSFTDTTTPNAKWWDGTDSNVEIDVLSSPGANMNVRFGGQPPNTITVGTPNGGEVFALGGQAEITWGANIGGSNVRIELHKGGSLHSVLAASETNDSTYTWNVSAGLPAAADYRIRVSSVNTPSIEDYSDADFALATEVWPQNGVMPVGWVTSAGANGGWELTTSDANEGQYSLQNVDISDNQEAAIEYTGTFQGGNISFDVRVSSETNWDFFRFFIDGVQQVQLSGEVAWNTRSYAVSTGTHTFKWQFDKDGSVDGGSDTAWIDSVVLPSEISPGPDIAVEEPVNTDLTDGVSTTSFGAVNNGASSLRTFTIRNVGLQNITGLAVSIDGTHSSQFSATNPAQTTLTNGQSTTFTVTFTPSGFGSRSANLHIASNDSDESPFDIALAGTAESSEIEVEHVVGGIGASPYLYGSGTGGNIYTVDRGTGASTLIGSSGLSGLSGLAFDPDTETLYGVDFTTDTLVTIDTNNGAATTVGPLGFNFSASGLTYDPINDVLYGITGGTLYSINTMTGAATQVGVGSSGFVGLAYDPNAQILYGVVNSTNDQLYTINPANGAQTLVGSLGIDPVLSGLAYDSANDVLYMNDYLGDVLYTINVSTGAATAVGSSVGGTDIQGLAFDPGPGPPVDLVDGVSGVNFGELAIGLNTPETFRVRNAGNLPLTGLAASFTGAHSSNYSAGAFGATTLQPGESTTVDIAFAPSATGVRTANLLIASNDPDENPFDVSLSGTGTQPEIVVEQPVGTNLTDGVSALDFGTVLPGVPQALALTIRNTGSTALTGLEASIDGANASDYSAGAFSSTTINPGQSATLTVTLTSPTTGIRSAALHIASNDADENPFDLGLTGFAADPEIVVEQPAPVPLVDGGSSARNFGSINIGEDSMLIFTVRNVGNLPLTGLAASFAGPAASDYTAGAFGATTLQAGESTTFAVTFSPGALGVRTASLDISSNDRDENPFDIDLTGSGVVPEIAVEQPTSVGLTDGFSTIDYGNTLVAQNSPLTFRIRNVGTGTLRNLTTSTVGANAAEFSATAPSSTTLSPGQSTTVVVTFSPAALGVRTASLRIGSNDSDENPFDVNLTGTAVSPEIAVEIGGFDVADGSSTAFPDLIGAIPASRIMHFVIRNAGNANLTNLEATISGVNASEFSATALNNATLPPNSSLTFTVFFTPIGFGDRTATLQIANNDPDENPFDITLTGARLFETSLSDWADTFGLTGDARLPTADDDGDNISLLEEYAYNLDPTVNDASPLVPGSGVSGLPIIQFVDVGGGERKLRAEFIRRRGDPNLTYEVQFGTNPNETPPDGFSASTEPEVSTVIDPGFKRVIIDDSTTTATDPKRFGRVKISYSAP